MDSLSSFFLGCGVGILICWVILRVQFARLIKSNRNGIKPWQDGGDK